MPALDTKAEPTQSRSQDTYEHILETAGRLLEHVGFEELSTNLICQKAGMTPPALYRYFPNKYAVLKILGERLMAAQDALVDQWLIAGTTEPAGADGPVNRIASLLRSLITVTKEFPGGIAISRAIHAVPLLRQLHIESREAVVTQICGILQPQIPTVPPARLRMASRMVSQLTSGVVEMVIEEPGPDTDSLIYEAAFLFASYFRAMQESTVTS
ncbi:TetR/AcrR family transcriptional regulator [Paraburkholderia sp. J12]|uniref:TetR/AcrR family transcriptional regulator n=1 Tax=Paraburkholderia sp. J12 TaxID=2805432 RepID=UPI002ABE767A|nr:TetR/AcrR family transcriptional regulator [Paraburkholderia sp. J12]